MSPSASQLSIDRVSFSPEVVSEPPNNRMKLKRQSSAFRKRSQTEILSRTLANKETKWLKWLRAAVLFSLFTTALIISVGVYLYTWNKERTSFSGNFHDNAHQVLDSFHDTVDRTIEAIGDLSTTYTSYALDRNLTFPNVTLPDFALMGSHTRTESGSFIIHYFPVVTEDNRLGWEAYAEENRNQINDAFATDRTFREQQDVEIRESREVENRKLQRNMTILDDGSGFHPKIWNNGALNPDNLGDEPEGAGPYLPAWQRSPINGAKQKMLNLNFAGTRVVGPGLLDTILTEKKAGFRPAVVPIPKYQEQLKQNLQLSQYRENIGELTEGLSTFMAYPVFGSFDNDREVVGVLATNLYWKVLLSNLLPAGATGIICVFTNSIGQEFTYRLDGAVATYLGQGDLHDEKFDEYEVLTSVNEYLKGRFSARNRAYTTVAMSDTIEYWLHVYPSQDTADIYISYLPIVYAVAMLFAFVFASAVFVVFSNMVEKRQRIMLKTVVEKANQVASTERELNEFLSHEIRNPLSAALSACSFLTTALNEASPLSDPEALQCAREDIEVANSSLAFINDFLRSMLDIHKLNGNHLRIEKAPADVLKDILEPVSAIIYQRGAPFEVILDCPEGLIIQTDALRLKQVVLNLARNSSKFVQQGFVRLRAVIEEKGVVVYVEDSGPGIPEEKRANLFEKYQTSLDLLSQGTGLGLNLAKKLMVSLEGDVSLDEKFDSGIEGCPGARFVLQLNTLPVDIETSMSMTEVTVPEVDDSIRIVKQSRIAELRESAMPPDEHKSQRTSFYKLQVPTVEEPELPTELSVLFVEDDAMLRKLFIRGLKKVQPDWKVKEASSGEMALKVLETYTPDLIFLDQYMASSEKSLLGTETCTAMRSRGVKAVICGLSANDIRDSFIKAGANDFILKPMPCKAPDLQNTLLALLSPTEIHDAV